MSEVIKVVEKRSSASLFLHGRLSAYRGDISAWKEVSTVSSRLSVGILVLPSIFVSTPNSVRARAPVGLVHLFDGRRVLNL